MTSRGKWARLGRFEPCAKGVVLMHTSQGKGSTRKATLVMLLSFVVMGVASVAVKAACHQRGRIIATVVMLLSLGWFGVASGAAGKVAWQRRHGAASKLLGRGAAAPQARRDAQKKASNEHCAPTRRLH